MIWAAGMGLMDVATVYFVSTTLSLYSIWVSTLFPMECHSTSLDHAMTQCLTFSPRHRVLPPAVEVARHRKKNRNLSDRREHYRLGRKVGKFLICTLEPGWGKQFDLVIFIFLFQAVSTSRHLTEIGARVPCPFHKVLVTSPLSR